MTRDGKLGRYRSRRDVRKTREPRGGARRSRSRPVFVIQKHDASTLHYDFRLEVGGVLKSWAVPKGPSTDPRVKRLAVPTEDHPLEYAGFEGMIPEGEYGAGAVLVWDTGPYTNIREEKGRPVPMARAIREGHVTVRLEGKKIRGGYALVRTGGSRWLLVKTRDDDADARRNPVSTEPDSVLSGRSLRDIRRDAAREDH